jgi:hypothetical protein
MKIIKRFCGGLCAKRHAPCAFPLVCEGKKVFSWITGIDILFDMW